MDEQLPTIDSAQALDDHRVCLTWRNGTTARVDLAEPVYRLKGLRALRKPEVFAQVRIAEHGRALEWPGDIDIGADTLWGYTLAAVGRDDAVTFRRWRRQHGLSLAAAAEALGISRRMVAYYYSGEKRVPKTVLLATRGWEALHDDAA
jgi:hypothetical protein